VASPLEWELIVIWDDTEADFDRGFKVQMATALATIVQMSIKG
jgi:hypothetical protein